MRAIFFCLEDFFFAENYEEKILEKLLLNYVIKMKKISRSEFLVYPNGVFKILAFVEEIYSLSPVFVTSIQNSKLVIINVKYYCIINIGHQYFTKFKISFHKTQFFGTCLLTIYSC